MSYIHKNETGNKKKFPGRKWWGDFSFEKGICLYWSIGPLEIFFQRMMHEWRISPNSDENNIESTCLVTGQKSATDLLDHKNLIRVGVRDTTGLLNLIPKTADRYVVSRPEIPFLIPSGEIINSFFNF